MIANPTPKLSPAEAARRLGVSVRRVQQLADSGALIHERTPIGRLFDAADVDRLGAERAAGSA